MKNVEQQWDHNHHLGEKSEIYLRTYLHMYVHRPDNTIWGQKLSLKSQKQ